MGTIRNECWPTRSTAPVPIGLPQQRSIHFAGKPLGRPKQETEENREQLKQAKAQRKQDYTQRIPIEDKFDKARMATGSTISGPSGRTPRLPGLTASSWS